MSQLTLEYPIWYVIFCLIVGGVFSFFLYWKNNFSDSVNKNLVFFLAGLRFLLISFLCFLLLSPFIKNIVQEIEKPIIIFAQDNSASIQLGNDSSFLHIEYKENVNQLIQSLSNKYEVKTYSFGEKTTAKLATNYQQKKTDISLLFSEINALYDNRNLGAIILASDGLYNSGTNPIYTSAKLKRPVYTIALGDSASKIDIGIGSVSHNKIAFLGNQFPIEVVINSEKLKGKEVNLKIFSGKKLLHNEVIKIESNRFHTTFSTLILADSKGIHEYTVTISEFPEERNLENNRYRFYVEILEGRQKILILTSAPHPDIAAIKHAIENNDNYTVTVALLKDFKGNLDEYNLLILNQQKNKHQKLHQQLSTSNLPVLYLLGMTSDIRFFNSQKLGLSITGSSNKSNESQTYVNESFSLFTIAEENKKIIKQFPPLITPFGNYATSNTSEILLKQKIGIVETNQPILFFNKNIDKKYGVIVGEGLWKWRMNNYAIQQNHVVFDELIQKTVQYLAVKDDKKRFRLSYENKYNEGDAILFNAELYNDTYEKINSEEVSMKITDESGNSYDYNFSTLNNEYQLNAGTFPVGKYFFIATAQLKNKVLEEKGEFSINPVQLEALNLKANHNLLYNVAESTGGKLFYPNQMKELSTLINKNDEIKSISFSHDELNDLINFKWILLILLSLISIEWLIRKRSGTY